MTDHTVRVQGMWFPSCRAHTCNFHTGLSSGW